MLLALVSLCFVVIRTQFSNKISWIFCSIRSQSSWNNQQSLSKLCNGNLFTRSKCCCKVLQIWTKVPPQKKKRNTINCWGWKKRLLILKLQSVSNNEHMESAASQAPPPGTTFPDSNVRRTAHKASCRELTFSQKKKNNKKIVMQKKENKNNNKSELGTQNQIHIRQKKKAKTTDSPLNFLQQMLIGTPKKNWLTSVFFPSLQTKPQNHIFVVGKKKEKKTNTKKKIAKTMSFAIDLFFLKNHFAQKKNKKFFWFSCCQLFLFVCLLFVFFFFFFSSFVRAMFCLHVLVLVLVLVFAVVWKNEFSTTLIKIISLSPTRSSETSSAVPKYSESNSSRPSIVANETQTFPPVNRPMRRKSCFCCFVLVLRFFLAKSPFDFPQ